MRSVPLISTAPNLFFSKNDLEDQRLGDHFKASAFPPDSFKPDDVSILGYPDDEGIKLTGGRPGAFEAPKTIRQFLYKMTWPLREKTLQNYFDFGDLPPVADLADRHTQARQLMGQLHRGGARTLSFGGGHDYGYPDTSAFVQSYLHQGEKPVVINFDAHLDVRPTNNGLNSGTPFYRLLSEYGDQIDLIEIGLQPQCNSLGHRDWALSQKAHLFDLQDFQKDGLISLFERPVFKKITPKTPVFVSFDIDALTSSEAGGCSQSWVTGLKTQDCLDFLARLYLQGNCRGLGIYEVSPALDLDYRTSKTAALLAYYFIFHKDLGAR